MYNEERKLAWISELQMKDSTKSTMQTYMNRIAGYEEKYGKDCCEFTREEILAFYTEYDASSVVSISNMNSKYKVYTDWCVDKGYTTENVYATLTIFDWEGCVTNEIPIISRGDLLDLFSAGYVGKISNPCDQFLCLALFEGICGTRMSELIYLTLDDFRNGKVYLNSGRELTVSKELLRLAEESASTYEKSTYSLEVPTKKLKDEPYILKASANTFSDKDYARMYNLRKALVKCKELTGVNALNQLSLVESGRISMIKQFMEEQGHDRWEDAFKANAKEINYRYKPELKKDKLLPYSRKYGMYLD